MPSLNTIKSIEAWRCDFDSMWKAGISACIFQLTEPDFDRRVMVAVLKPGYLFYSAAGLAPSWSSSAKLIYCKRV